MFRRTSWVVGLVLVGALALTVANNHSISAVFIKSTFKDAIGGKSGALTFPL